MFDRLKKMLAPGIVSKYETTGVTRRFSLYKLTRGQSRKGLRAVLIKEYSQEGLEIQRKLDRLFRTEPLAKVLPCLNDPHVVKTIEAETTESRRVEILENCSGLSLRDALAEGRLAPRELVETILDVADGLGYLHSQGFVLRHLTPESVTLTEQGAVINDLSFLMDAGKARMASTMTGVNRYSAPEIIRRSPVDHRSDIFSLGAILYEGLCGVGLFPHTTGFEKLLRVMNSTPEMISARNAYVADELERVVMKAVARAAGQRHASVGEFIAELSKAPLPEKLGFHAPAFAA